MTEPIQATINRAKAKQKATGAPWIECLKWAVFTGGNPDAINAL